MASPGIAGGVSDPLHVSDDACSPSAGDSTMLAYEVDDFVLIDASGDYAPRNENALRVAMGLDDARPREDYRLGLNLPRASHPAMPARHGSAASPTDHTITPTQSGNGDGLLEAATAKVSPPIQAVVEGGAPTPVKGEGKLSGQRHPGDALLAATLPLATLSSVPVALAPAIAAVSELTGLGGVAAQVANATSSAASSVRSAARSAEQVAGATNMGARGDSPLPHPKHDSIPSRRPSIDGGDADSWVGVKHRKRDTSSQTTHEPHTPGRVRLGDNSIVTTGITEVLAIDVSGTENKIQGTFFSHMGPRLLTRHHLMTVVNHQVYLSSTLYPNTVGGRLDPGVNLASLVFPSFGAPVQAADRTTLTIRPGPSVVNSTIEASALTAFLNGGAVSERAVVSGLQPKLQIANTQAARFLSEYITSALEYCDNYLMYGKLYYQAMVLDLIQAVGLQPAVDAFPAGDNPQFVNLNAAALDYMDVARPIVRGDIVLVQSIDYEAADLQIVTWLAKPGTRASAAGGAHIPHACYVAWPAIPVTVLIHGNAPAVPAAADLTSHTIFTYVERLATSRGEWDAALRGLYLAADLLGVRYARMADVDAGRHHFRMSNQSFHSPTIPAVRDYNVLLRVLGHKPHYAPQSRVEVEALTMQAPNIRTNLMAVYTASISAATTTILYDYNITHELMSAWGTGAQLSATAIAVIQQLSHPMGGAGYEAPLLAQIKRLFTVYLAVVIPDSMYPGNLWLGAQAGSAHAQVAYVGLHENTPPRSVNPLILDNYWVVRPLEWGISGPCTNVNLAGELVQMGPAAHRGWRAVRGEKQYGERAEGALPCIIVPYGNQVLNAIANDGRWAVVHEVTFSLADWGPGGTAEWVRPQADAHRQGVFIPALHCWEPCTLLTFSYPDEIIMAPALTGDIACPAALVGHLANWKGGIQPMVGFGVGTELPTGPTSSLGQALHLSGMFRGMGIAAGTPPQSSGNPN